MKIIKLLFKFLCFFIFLPVYFGILALSPIVKFRFGFVHGVKIGHLIYDPILYSLERRRSKKIIVDFFIDRGFYSNSIAKDIFYRNNFVLPFWTFLIVKVFDILKLRKFYWRSEFFNGISRDLDSLIYKYDHTYKLNECEMTRARQMMESFGYDGKKPVAVLHVRDEGYHFNNRVVNDFYRTDHVDPGPDSYRNSQIGSYKKAVQCLLSRGFWVVRLGRHTKEKLNISHPNFFDYSQSDYQDDLIDIWLCEICDLFISTSSGIDCLPVVNKKPVLFLNALPLACALTGYSKIMWVPKNLFWKDSNRELNLAEYLEAFYLNSKSYAVAGIRIEDLSEDEIFGSVEDFLSRIETGWAFSNDEELIRERVKCLFESSKYYKELNGSVSPKFTIGLDWIGRKNCYFLRPYVEK